MRPEPSKLFYDSILARLSFLEGEVKRLNEAKDTADLQDVMGGSRPLRERYEDALEVVRKQALRIEELEAAPSMFQDLLQSSAALVTRFKGKLSYTGVFLKVDEEHREYLEAISEIVEGQPMSFNLSKPETLRSAAAEELIDCIVTLGGMASYAGLTWDDIEAAAKHVIKKNTDKTDKTHVWHEETKTVMRRDKLETLK